MGVGRGEGGQTAARDQVLLCREDRLQHLQPSRSRTPPDPHAGATKPPQRRAEAYPRFREAVLDRGAAPAAAAPPVRSLRAALCFPLAASPSPRACGSSGLLAPSSPVARPRNAARARARIEARRASHHCWQAFLLACTCRMSTEPRQQSRWRRRWIRPRDTCPARPSPLALRASRALSARTRRSPPRFPSNRLSVYPTPPLKGPARTRANPLPSVCVCTRTANARAGVGGTRRRSGAPSAACRRSTQAS